MYEIFDHTADLGLRVRAGRRDELYCDAAKALFSVIVANLDAIERVQVREVRVSGSDDELLLFDWLSELLYVFEVEHLLLVEFSINFDAEGLVASCRGEHYDPTRHRLEHEVKAITYHGLKVQSDDQGWLAEVIVDI